MEVIKTKIEGLLIIEPAVFGDERGFFMETYNKEGYNEVGVTLEFVQDNLSKSAKGVLRGLHYQVNPNAQGKLVYVARGAVMDVAVDIRHSSPTFGEYVAVELTEENKKQFWIPPGFAHGFVSLKDETIFAYKCTALYSPENERSIIWNDKDLAIDWGLEDPTVSEKDQKAKAFNEIEKDFIFNK